MLERASVRELASTYPAERLSRAIVQGLRDDAFARFDVGFRLAAELVEPSDAEEALAWVERYWGNGAGVSDAIAGWDYHVGLWLMKLVRHEPQAVRLRLPEWEAALQEQARFCLARSGHEPFATSTLEKLAKLYLNAAPGRFAYEERVPLEALSAACEALLAREAYPILQPARLEALVELGASAGLRVALVANYCGQDFRRRALQGLEPAGPEALSDARRRLRATTPLSFEGRIALGMFLAVSLGEQLLAEPDELRERVRQALELDLRSGTLVDLEISARALRALPGCLRASLLEATLDELRSTALVPALADARLLRLWLERVEAGRIDVDSARDTLFRAQQALPSLVEQLRQRPQHAAPLVVALAEAMGEAGGAGAAELLVGWLHHSSRAAVTAASRGLERLGRAAEPALLAARETPRRQVRDVCERLLARLQHQQAARETPLAEVEARAQQLGTAARDEFLRACERWAQRPELWQVELRPRVLRVGAVALLWLRAWFDDHVRRGEARLWCEVVEWLAHDPAAVWVAVETFAGMPKLGSQLWSRPRRALAQCGQLVNAPIAEVLARGATEYAEPLYGLLAQQARRDTLPLLVAGLREPSKAIRAHCVDALSRFEGVELSPLLEALGSSSLGTRLSVAELFAVWGRREAAEALLRALASNKSRRLEPYLHEALVSCAGIERVVEGSPHEARWLEAVAGFLARQHAEPPRFARIPPLPELRWRDGRTLDEASQAGFLACATRLDATLKGRLLRALKPAFEASSLADWSREVHERWARSKDPRHKWAVLQLWLFADDATIGQVAERVGQLRSSEHAALACYLRALQWHDSQPAVDWLVHFACALPSRGTRALAQQSLQRIAFKRQLDAGQLRARADHWVAAAPFERSLASDDAPHDERLERYLCRSWLTGRWFTYGWLRQLTPKYHDVLLGSLFQDSAGARLLWAQSQLLDADQRPLAVPDSARLRLVHPVLLSATELSRWRPRVGALSRRALERLQRPVFVSSGDPDVRLADVTTDSLRLERWLRRHGWFHGEPLEQGVVYDNCCLLLQRNLCVRVVHTGYAIGARDVEPVELLQLEFETLDGAVIDADDVPPEVYSEICWSLCRLPDGG